MRTPEALEISRIQAQKMRISALLVQCTDNPPPLNIKLATSIGRITFKRTRQLDELRTRLESASTEPELNMIETELSKLQEFDTQLRSALPGLSHALIIEHDESLGAALIER